MLRVQAIEECGEERRRSNVALRQTGRGVCTYAATRADCSGRALGVCPRLRCPRPHRPRLVLPDYRCTHWSADRQWFVPLRAVAQRAPPTSPESHRSRPRWSLSATVDSWTRRDTRTRTLRHCEHLPGSSYDSSQCPPDFLLA